MNKVLTGGQPVAGGTEAQIVLKKIAKVYIVIEPRYRVIPWCTGLSICVPRNLGMF